MEYPFVKNLTNDKAHVRLITVNGFQMTGRIKDQDDRAVLIKEDGGVEKLVYKHAISTIEQTTR